MLGPGDGMVEESISGKQERIAIRIRAKLTGDTLFQMVVACQSFAGHQSKTTPPLMPMHWPAGWSGDEVPFEDGG